METEPDQPKSPLAASMSRNARKRPLPPLLIAGPFPPPVHGFSVITAAMSAEIAQLRDVELCDLSSAHPAAIARNLAQAGKCLRTMARIIGFRLRGGRAASIGANGGWGMLYTLGLVAAARASGLKMFLHHHSYAYIDRRSGLMATLCAIGGARLQHVFLAQSMQEAFFARYPQKSAALLLPNAIFVPTRPTRATRSAGRIRVGLLSNLGPEKGLYDFIETARQVKAAQLPVEMLLAGPVPRPQDAKAINAAEAEGLLRALGPLYGKDKYAFFQKLDLFLFPTRYLNEAQPTVIYEALAAGVPVLAFARGAIADQVRDCLPSLPLETVFASAALAAIHDYALLPAGERDRISALASARHAEDREQGRQTIRFLANVG